MFSAFHDVGSEWMEETPKPRRPQMSPPHVYAPGGGADRSAEAGATHTDGVWMEEEMSPSERAIASRIEGKLAEQQRSKHPDVSEAPTEKPKPKGKAKGKAKAKTQPTKLKAKTQPKPKGKAKGKAKAASSSSKEAAVPVVKVRTTKKESATFAGRRRSQSNPELAQRFDTIKNHFKNKALSYKHQEPFWHHMVAQLKAGKLPGEAAAAFSATDLEPEGLSEKVGDQAGAKLQSPAAQRKAYIQQRVAAGETLATAVQEWHAKPEVADRKDATATRKQTAALKKADAPARQQAKKLAAREASAMRKSTPAAELEEDDEKVEDSEEGEEEAAEDDAEMEVEDAADPPSSQARPSREGKSKAKADSQANREKDNKNKPAGKTPKTTKLPVIAAAKAKGKAKAKATSKSAAKAKTSKKQ